MSMKGQKSSFVKSMSLPYSSAFGGAPVFKRKGSSMLLKRGGVCTLFMLLSLSILSCGEDSGLGASVDVEKPSVTISNPPDSAAIKGTFVFAGTCSDDKGVETVTVTVESIDDSDFSPIKLSADVVDSLTWTVSVNKLTDSGYELTDGKYKLSVQSRDKSGRESDWVSRTFEIDNTAPVFVISKPGVVRSTYIDNSSLSKYGSLFTVEGTIADDHAISTMELSIYDEEGNLINSEPYLEKEVSTTGGTSVTIARHIEGGSEPVNTRYNDVYSVGTADSDGNKVYSCTVTVSDAAKEYTTADSTGEGDGNKTSVVYLYDSIYDDYMSAKKGAGLSANDFKAVINGNATDAGLKGKGSKTVTVAEVKEALASMANDTSSASDKSLSFSLNPDADPTYSISSFSLSYDEDGKTISSGANKAMGEQPLTIIVSAGLDQVNVVPSSLKVWIKKISEADKTPTSKEALASDIESLVDSVKDYEKNETDFSTLENVCGWKLMCDNSSDQSPTDTTVSVSTEIPGENFVEANAYYAIVVTGHDKDDIDLSQSKLYGFMGTISAVAPSVSIKSPKNLSYFKDSTLEFKGTATENNAGMSLRALKATLTVTDETTGEEIEDSKIEISITGDSDHNWTSENGLSCEYDSAAKTNKWTFTPSLCDDYEKIKVEEEGLMYMYTLSVEAEGSANLTYSESISVHIDTTNPTVTISSITPSVSGSEYFGDTSEYKDYTFINGTVNIKGSIEEQNLEKVTYDVWASTNLEKTLTSDDSILSELKSYVSEKGLGIDIDGSMGKIYQITKSFPTTLITNYFIDKVAGFTEDAPIQVELVITATDKVGNTGVYKSGDYNEDGSNFVIWQETDRPKITLGNADTAIASEDGIKSGTNLFGTTTNNTLQISVTDDDSIVDYEIYIWKYGADEPENPSQTENPGKTSDSINYKLPSEEGTYNVKVIARDFLRSGANTDDNNPKGIKKINTFCIGVDSGAPNVVISEPDNESWVTVGKDITVSATVSKKEGVTVTGKIYKENAEQTEENLICSVENISIADTADSEGKYAISGTFKLPNDAQGRYTVVIKAEDKYKQSTEPSVTVGVDSIAPVWEENNTESPFLVNKKSYSYTEGSATHTWYNSSSMAFQGSYKEAADGSGIESIYYKIIQAGQEDVTPTAVSDFDSANSFVASRISGTDYQKFNTNLGEFIVNNDESGNARPNIVYLMAVDKAGNVSEVKKLYIYIDAENPTMESDKTGSQYSNKSLAIDVTGKATDDASGIDTVKLYVTVDGNSTPLIISGSETEIPANVTDSPMTGDPNNKVWEATIPSTFLGILENKTYAVKSLVTDRAGNKATSTIFRIAIDAGKPVIKNLSFTNDSEKYSVYPSDENTFFVHNTDGNKFTLSGSVMDSISGIESIVINDGSKNIKSATSLPIGDIDLSSYNDSVELKVTAIDNAGNTESSILTVKFDNKAPKGLHALDSKSKDVFFRVGDQDNDDITSSDSLWSDSLDKNVGGKYSEGTYGNASTIRIRGTIDDESGSGLSMIYYKVISDEKTQTELENEANDFLDNYKTNADGYFAPLKDNKIEVRRVFYTPFVSDDGDVNNEDCEKISLASLTGYVSDSNSLGSGKKSYATIKTNFDTVISGFAVGKNYLFLVAVDNVGNADLDRVKVKDTSDSTGVALINHPDVSMNVDTEVPTVTSDDSGIKYSNATKDIELSGTAVDNGGAGIRSLVIKVNGKEIKVGDDLTADSTYGTITRDGDNWSATVKGKAFSGASGSVSVQMIATDNAGSGNSQTENIATVVVDLNAPVATLNLPDDADTESAGTQINGTISLSGTITDANVLPENAITRIEYKGGDASDWTDLSTKVDSLNLSGSSTFTVTGFDTTRLSDNTTYYLRAVATDTAGNEGVSSAITVAVSQDSDRPKVNFNNIEYSENLKTYLLKHGTDAQVTGRISDDDSNNSVIVKKFLVSETAYTGADGETEPTNLLGSSLTSSGDFTITPSDKSDGEKKFYIYIEDNDGKKFYTTYTPVSGTVTTNDKLQNPKIYVKNTRNESSENAMFTYKSDSKNPTIGQGKGLPYSDSAATTLAKDSSGNAFALTGENASNSNLGASFVIGGTERRYVKFYFTGNDASGIAKMTAIFTKSESSTTTTLETLETADGWAGTQSGESDASWTTDVVDTNGWGTGQIAVSVTITDRVGLETTSSFTFMADNEAPDISISKPTNGSHETQAVTIAGTAFDTGDADTDTIKWAIPTTEQASITNQDTLKSTLIWNSFMKSDKTAKNWEFVFDDSNVTDEEKTDKSFTNGNPLLDLFDNSNYATAVDGIYPLHIYLMATDKIGNFTIKTDYIINHDPDGDRPKTTFSYPTTADYAEGASYATLGGTIRASGQSVIPYGDATAKEVYFQLVEETATSFTKDYVSGLKYTDSTGEHNAYTIVTASDILGSAVVTSISSETDATKKAELLRKYGFSSESDLTNWWGIKANGSASWNFSINEHDELNATSGNTTNNIKIRVCGVNSNNKFGAWSDGDNIIHIHVSSGVPQFTYSVAQFSGTPTLTSEPTVEQPYSADMYLKGQWYIIVSATDDSQITEITATEGTSTVSGLVKDTAAAKTMKIIVPMSAESGNHTYTVSAKDDTNNTSKMPFSVIIDNTAPTLSNVRSGAEVIFSDASGVTNTIENSNTFFTLAGESEDTESGVEYVAFYYMRNKGTPTDEDKAAGTNNVIFDPLIPNGSGADAYSSARVKMGDLQERTIKQGETSYYLWAKAVEGTMPAKNQFTANDALDSHVRVGGLVEIGGVYKKITKISDDKKTVTVDGDFADTTKTNAYFPIAQIIDATNTQNTSNSNTGTNVGKFVFDANKDDGDGMPESFSKSGSLWSWDATIYSNNMPDGPVSLVVIAFDKAGNVNGKTYPAMISNNAPRMAKIHLGTDLNHGGTYSDNEFETYNIVAKTGASEKVYTLTTQGYSKYALDTADKWQEAKSTRGSFKAKNKLAVLPELVGGNGEIKLVFNNNDTTNDDGKQTGTPVTRTRTITSTESDKHSIIGDYWELSNELGTDGEKTVSFTFWDSTEQTTSGTDSLYAFLRVNDLVVAQTDNTAPNVVVNPFFWTSASENSLYTNSKDNGHIELEADLPTATFSATATSGEYDRDPKVSGKIVVRGTAYDETLLGSLSFSMTDFDASTTTPIEIATYSGGVWTNKKTNAMATNYYEVTVTDDYLSQDGHNVNWEIAIDTAHLSNTTKLDAVFTVIAKDAITTPHSSANSTGKADGTTDATKHKPSYQMDVVPYVTGISRNSKYNTNRARSGATPLLRGETENTITGFNLGKASGSTIAITLNTKADGTGTNYNLTSPTVVTAGSKLSFTMPATAKDGYLTVSIDGIKTLNNLNSDSVSYNKENTANVSSTDYWTDTRYVRVWQSNTDDYFAGSTLPIYPSMAMGSGGTLYASFSNYSASSVYYSTIGGTATQVFYGYDPPEETDICVSGTGTVNVVYNANYHGGSEASWAADSNSCGGLYMYDKNAASVYVGRDYRQILRFELFYHNRMLQQFKNMRVKRSDSANNGIVHVAYYDRTTSSIHYSEVKSNYSYTIVNDRNTGWEDYSYNEISWVNIDGGYDEDDNKYHNGTSSGTYNDKIKSVYLTDARFEDTKRCEGTGESVGLALTQTKHYPVVVYYDASNSVLKLARATSETPKGDVSKWSVQEVLSATDSNYKTMVDYIACDIDSEGKLHIVFQNTKGQLCYIKSTNASADGATKYTFGQSVVVADSATNIDLTLHGTVPYISYLGRINSFDGMNIAFWDSTLDLDCDGTAEGGWETMTAALSQKVSNVKSCIEAHPTPASADWEAAVGFTPGDLYRVAYYVGNGGGH